MKKEITIKKFSIFFIIITMLPILGLSQSKSESRILWMDLKKAEKFAKKYDRPMFIYFYRPNCEYCEKMKQETLADSEIAQFINQNFYPVMINATGYDTITYNRKRYFNQQPEEDVTKKGKKPWRHDLFHKFHELYGNCPGGTYTYPTTFIIDGEYKEVNQLCGYQPKLQYQRGLKKSVSKK